MTTEQKQLLGVGGGALALVVVWRRIHKSGSGNPTVVQPVGGGIQPYTPQSITTLDPGQSVYDPNSEGLLTTPTAPGTGETTLQPGDTIYDPSAPMGTPQNPGSMPPPPQAAAPSNPGYVVNVVYPPAATKAPAPKKPVQRPSYAPKNAKHTGRKSPGPGWRGIGGGWWAPPKKKAKAAGK